MKALLARILMGAALAFAATAAFSQAPQNLYTYEGADRMDKLVAAAKKEGELMLYTTIAERDLKTIVDPFEKKYGIKVTIWRAGTDKVLQRTVQEQRAKRYTVDVVHYGAPEMEALARENILAPVNSPVFKDLRPGSVPAHHKWAATILSVWVQPYNTNEVKKADLPKTYQDLLDPKWKGKLGIEAKDDDWFATVVQEMGGEQKGLSFFRELVAKNGITPVKGHTLLNEKVVSGEIPLALTVYNYMPEQAKRKGAPIGWTVIEPAVARANAVGVCEHAPHPNAALLFYEYLLGPDGQRAMTSIDYVPTNTTIESPLRGVKIVQTDPVRSLDEEQKWSKLFDEVVIKKAGPR
jgi:iron(III) transport system substrate-binding protein